MQLNADDVHLLRYFCNFYRIWGNVHCSAKKSCRACRNELHIFGNYLAMLRADYRHLLARAYRNMGNGVKNNQRYFDNLPRISAYPRYADAKIINHTRWDNGFIRIFKTQGEIFSVLFGNVFCHLQSPAESFFFVHSFTIIGSKSRFSIVWGNI